jgi:hypothetical protein
MERLTMAKTPTADSTATELTVPERLLLFCLATNTDWQKAGVPHATAHCGRALGGEAVHNLLRPWPKAKWL